MFVQSDAVAEQGGIEHSQESGSRKKRLASGNFVTIRGVGGCSKTVGSHSRQRLPIESQCPGPEGANRAPQEARWTL